MKTNPASADAVAVARECAREPRRTRRPSRRRRTPDKPRFDFYKILPGVRGAEGRRPSKRRPSRRPRVVDQAKDRRPTNRPDAGSAARCSSNAPAAQTPTRRSPGRASTAEAAKAADRFWLQAGSFSTRADAENLQARLALAGWEATVQEGALPDKSVRYRVRLGPYDNTDELGRMKTELAKRGFDVAVIRY